MLLLHGKWAPFWVNKYNTPQHTHKHKHINTLIHHNTCAFHRVCSPSSCDMSCWAAVIVSWAFVNSASNFAASAVWHWNLRWEWRWGQEMSKLIDVFECLIVCFAVSKIVFLSYNRFQGKVLPLTHKAPNNQNPSHLTNLLHYHTPSGLVMSTSSLRGSVASIRLGVTEPWPKLPPSLWNS